MNLKKEATSNWLINYTRKQPIATSARSRDLQTQAVPVFRNIRQTQGSHIENVVVPFTDGKKGMQVLANLDKTIQTEGRELTSALERQITLAVIDDAWKEHLRAMDDLKQSVQTAYLEQKDPLVIYKITAFDLFKQMGSELNKDIVGFLAHATIPIEQDNGGQQQQSTDPRRTRAEDRYEPHDARIKKRSMQEAMIMVRTKMIISTLPTRIQNQSR